ncbi:hypothetical protein HG536_0H02200 [Torulaspora globosa]|uniref:Uncharacterized protein n=1 Tax=Torulaspora globosa TaxID=48254 RepID=A0A7G3ZMV9_9SACH|nr:uncharacterized protein HG536_0H02200 [Torulaspora globosa]QLL34845.1 hypothetical protein HG536_0H02200 [Torulaspora globosa]
MSDPREVGRDDPYEQVTSAEEEQLELEEQIEEIERQRQDLMKRLEEKKAHIRRRDPNFVAIQVERSPIKKPVAPAKLKPSPTRRAISVENPNELKVERQLQIPANSTSYFIDRFTSSKRDEQNRQQLHQKLLSDRVHTFRGADGKREHKAISTNELEEFSDQWISQRFVPKEELQETLHEIKILRLNKLFAKVKPPKFSEPQYSNWAAVGIISGKGEIKFTSAEKPRKYFKFTLTNFQHNLEVYIFGKKSVERYYSLRVGAIVAILNPEVLPWRPSGKGNFIKSFNLRISHDFPCILEIGQSRDIGWCPGFNKSQQKACGAPINKAKETYCDYHKETRLRSNHAKRIELNGSSALGAPTRIDAQPALYRSRSPSAQNSFKVIPDVRTRKIDKKPDVRGIHFTNGNAAKAFFNDKFQNPDILNNLDNKRRKIEDRKKQKLLEKQLNLVNGKSIDMKNHEDFENARQTTEATLQSGFIERLGFDPTHGRMADVLKRTNRGKINDHRFNEKEREVSSLLSFRKEKVELKPSKEVLIDRKKGRERAWKETFGKKPEKDLSDSSESEIEII